MSTFITQMAAKHGFKMVDAKKPCRVHVTRVDTLVGKKKNQESCAFAQACRREKIADEAYFFRSTAWLLKGKVLSRYLLPPSMQKEIVAFDRGGTMAPGKYQLSAPNKSSRLDRVKIRSRRQRANGRTPRGHTNGKRKFVHHTVDVRGKALPNWWVG